MGGMSAELPGQPRFFKRVNFLTPVLSVLPLRGAVNCCRSIFGQYNRGVMIEFCLMSVVTFYSIFFASVVRWTRQTVDG
jgi:hypothetical protein